MKKYIHASSDRFIAILPIEITVEAPIPIAASFLHDADQKFFDERDDLILTVYEDLIFDICCVCEINGLHFLNYIESDSKAPDVSKSNSRYMDFCFNDEMDAGIVRVIFMLRVSDHKQTNKRFDGSDRRKSLENKQSNRFNEDLNKLKERNPAASGELYPFSGEIKVGGTVCPNYGAAINVLKKLIVGYRQSVESHKNDESGDTNEN